MRSLYLFLVAGTLVCFLQLGDSSPILKHGSPHFVLAMPTIAKDAFCAAAAYIAGEKEACCTSACSSSSPMSDLFRGGYSGCTARSGGDITDFTFVSFVDLVVGGW